ncbi:MAG: CapA family protein [Deltaproteobacteria bacterium]|nr:CapA family protein [Deltaproteobacteria bacterium]
MIEKTKNHLKKYNRIIKIKYFFTFLVLVFVTSSCSLSNIKGQELTPKVPEIISKKEVVVKLKPKEKVRPKPKEITLLALGDIMLSRGIGRAMVRRDNDYPFKFMDGYLKKGDIVFANLESMLGESKDKAGRNKKPYFKKPYNFLATPEASKVLKKAGLTILSLANNHAMDFGPSPIAETRRLLSKEGIGFFGAGKNLREAREAASVNLGDTNFSFIGYTIAHPDVFATKEKPGAASIYERYVIDDVRTLRKKTDVLIVSLHWGKEYKEQPTKWQRGLARKIIDAGADIIIGHHPHVLQGVEFYKNKPIAYSLGNFIFDQKSGRTTGGAIFEYKFKGSELYSFGIIPISRVNTYYPKVSSGKARNDTLKELIEISTPLNKDKTYLDALKSFSVLLDDKEKKKNLEKNKNKKIKQDILN